MRSRLYKNPVPKLWKYKNGWLRHLCRNQPFCRLQRRLFVSGKGCHTVVKLVKLVLAYK